ncbi:hypothetical protein I7I53_10790 [Histoplasma capsulatum var. duboisii H88]|uniref:Uncharacterized protein n=1 Tax=Ajellomyces capsulatus (strain H88) TaxID=544711 RepID=A0A8A1L989_AJEC8|nr:hypothetical protein I7I53_10790 [Histoplasma capsulatum var. duboisii H88]
MSAVERIGGCPFDLMTNFRTSTLFSIPLSTMNPYSYQAPCPKSISVTPFPRSHISAFAIFNPIPEPTKKKFSLVPTCIIPGGIIIKQYESKPPIFSNLIKLPRTPAARKATSCLYNTPRLLTSTSRLVAAAQHSKYSIFSNIALTATMRV